jgi:hypothetical protein
MKANCIICVYDDRYEIVGPFKSDAALNYWGGQWQRRNGGDPRWQSIYLADPAAMPKVVTPFVTASAG